MTNFDKIIDYENAMLTEQETIELFQDLVNTGLAWSLQGHYGRTARDLINSGQVTQPTTLTHQHPAGPPESPIAWRLTRPNYKGYGALNN